MRDIITTQDNIGNDVLNLGVIVLFAPRDRACEITEEVISLYNKIVDEVSKKMEYTLYSVIRLMIDAYSDDEDGYERRINMLNENTSVESTERFVTLEIMQNNLEIANNDLKVANSNLEIANNDLEVANDRIQQLEKENKKILKLEIENEMLKQQLNSK